jgi:hypothetical protein
MRTKTLEDKTVTMTSAFATTAGVTGVPHNDVPTSVSEAQFVSSVSEEGQLATLALRTVGKSLDALSER